MTSGPGLAALLPVVLTLAGLITMWRTARRRRHGRPPVDPDAERRRAATLETERRLAAYLAARDPRARDEDDT